MKAEKRAASAEGAEALKVNEKKWTKTLMQTGWTALPNIILECQKTLQLKPTDVNVLLHLARHWWEAGKHPHPAKGTIAKRIGVTPGTVRRSVLKMERAGLITRHFRKNESRGNLTNLYDFTGLIEKATPLAKDFLAEKEKRKREDEARARRGGRPKLEVVK
jgi:DNA-binding MarR family transcriptional regulator